MSRLPRLLLALVYLFGLDLPPARAIGLGVDIDRIAQIRYDSIHDELILLVRTEKEENWETPRWRVSILDRTGTQIRSFDLGRLGSVSAVELFPHSRKLVLADARWSEFGEGGPVWVVDLLHGSRKRLPIQANTIAADPKRERLFVGGLRQLSILDPRNGRILGSRSYVQRKNQWGRGDLIVGESGTVGFLQQDRDAGLTSNHTRWVTLAPPAYLPQSVDISGSDGYRVVYVSAFDERRNRLYLLRQFSQFADDLPLSVLQLGGRHSESKLSGSQYPGLLDPSESSPYLFIEDEDQESWVHVHETSTLRRVASHLLAGVEGGFRYYLGRAQQQRMLLVAWRGEDPQAWLELRDPLTFRVLREAPLGEVLADFRFVFAPQDKALFVFYSLESGDEAQMLRFDLGSFSVGTR